jgi:NADPH:quinone reductase-like Zn-dependent oxidoreductase
MAGGIGKNIKINQNAPLPSGATTLAEDSTLAKVAYSSINPVDYKLPGFSIFHALKMSNPGTPARDYAGTSIAITLLGPQPSDLIFARSGPPTFGALADYLVVHGKENVLKMPDGIDIVAVASLGVAGLTACQCNAPRVKKGSKVFINGDSGGTKSIRYSDCEHLVLSCNHKLHSCQHSVL